MKIITMYQREKTGSVWYKCNKNTGFFIMRLSKNLVLYVQMFTWWVWLGCFDVE